MSSSLCDDPSSQALSAKVLTKLLIKADFFQKMIWPGKLVSSDLHWIFQTVSNSNNMHLSLFRHDETSHYDFIQLCELYVMVHVKCIPTSPGTLGHCHHNLWPIQSGKWVSPDISMQASTVTMRSLTLSRIIFKHVYMYTQPSYFGAAITIQKLWKIQTDQLLTYRGLIWSVYWHTVSVSRILW